jgi:hypothetical protein
MEANKSLENERAHRIHLRINECHLLLANVYENLVDRKFPCVNRDARVIIMELKFILKSMEEDDF